MSYFNIIFCLENLRLVIIDHFFCRKLIMEVACAKMPHIIDAALQGSITPLAGSRETNSKKEKSDNINQACDAIQASINQLSIAAMKQISQQTKPDENIIRFPNALAEMNNIRFELNGQPNYNILDVKMNNDLKLDVTTPSQNGKPEFERILKKTLNGEISKESAKMPSPRLQPKCSASDNNEIVKVVKTSDVKKSELVSVPSPLRAAFALRNTPIKQKPAIPASETINPNDKVVISSVSDIHTVFVRPKLANENFQKILDEGDSDAALGKKLTELPERSDMVLAPYENHYFRAIIMKAESKVQPIQVAFIDFGNADEIMFDDLKEISSSLAAHKRVITKISLKPLPDQLKADEVLSYLDKAGVNGIEFTIQFDSDVPIKQAVCDLILPNGKSYLDEIIALKTAQPERPLSPILEVESNVVRRSVSIPNGICIKLVMAQNKLFWFWQDIGFQKVTEQEVDVTLINNDLTNIGIITIILTKDEQTLIANEEKVKTCGQSLEKAASHKPK